MRELAVLRVLNSPSMKGLRLVENLWLKPTTACYRRSTFLSLNLDELRYYLPAQLDANQF